jgi:CBS domain-containing protein
MQRDVVTVGPDDTLQDALKLMTENHVTGLPVMDHNCRCIGLIAASDILNYQEEHSTGGVDRPTTQFFDPDTQQWEDIPLVAFNMEELAELKVADLMTRDLIWVHRDTPLQHVARRMIDEQVHRVLVMDADFHLYGILSAYDFVRLAAET